MLSKLAHTAGAILDELPGAVSDRVQLLVLEARQAGRAAARFLVVVVVGCLLFATAWITACGAIGYAAIERGADWRWAAVTIIVANVLAAIAVIPVARGFLHRIALPATVRRLTVSPTASSADTGSKAR